MHEVSEHAENFGEGESALAHIGNCEVQVEHKRPLQLLYQEPTLTLWKAPHTQLPGSGI